MTEPEKPTSQLDFCLIGSGERGKRPTLEDMIALATHLTGKDPTSDEIAEVKAELEADGYPIQ